MLLRHWRRAGPADGGPPRVRRRKAAPCPRAGLGRRTEEEARGQAPGRSRMCLATMLSWISEVPPSMELALVRSHDLAAAPPPDASLSHSSASEPPAAIISSARALFSSVP